MLGPFTTALAQGELLTELRLGDPPAGARHGFAEIARRRGDFALAGAAVVVAPGHARVALFAVAPCAFRATEAAERALTRRRRRGGGGGARRLGRGADGDPHATAAYRRESRAGRDAARPAGCGGAAWLTSAPCA